MSVVNYDPEKNKKITEESLLLSLGSHGLKQSGGWVLEEFLTNLRGRQGVQYYKEMRANSSMIGALLVVFESLLCQVEWDIKASDDENPAAVAEKEFMESVLKDMNHTWEDHISEVVSFFTYGWAFFEIVYKLRKGDTDNPETNSLYSDGRYGIRELAFRSQETLWKWEFDPSNNPTGLIQQDTYLFNTGASNVLIPMDKAVLYRTTSFKGNPEGRSILRSAVRDYHFMKNLQEQEAIVFERLGGVPKISLPPEYFLPDAGPKIQAIRNQMEVYAQEFKNNQKMGVVWPSELDREGKPTGHKFELMQLGIKSMSEFDIAISRNIKGQARSVLAGFLTLGDDSVGSHAMWNGQEDLFSLALNMYLRRIAADFNQQVIGPLMKLNDVSRELWPELVAPPMENVPLDKLANLLTAMGSTGLLPTDSKEISDKVLSFAGLPTSSENDDDDITLDPDNPTPREASDQALGILSPEQINMVADLNRQVKRRDLDFEVARELAAASLGMSVQAVERFIKEPEPREEPPPPPPQVVPDANAPGPQELNEPAQANGPIDPNDLD